MLRDSHSSSVPTKLDENAVIILCFMARQCHKYSFLLWKMSSNLVLIETNQSDSFSRQHLITHQHSCIGWRLLLSPPHGGLPRRKPHLVTHPPAELSGGQLRHPVAHQAYAASHRRRQLQDLPRAVCQRHPAKAWEPGR